MDIFKSIVLLALLVICSITDIKSRNISIKICVLFGVLSVGIRIISELMSGGIDLIKTAGILCGTLPGLIIALISIITKGGIGRGDAVVFIVIGLLMGIRKSVGLFVMALLCVEIICVPLLCIKRVGMKNKVPFMPFVLLSYIVVLCI